MSEPFQFVSGAEHAGRRVDTVVASSLDGISRSLVQRLLLGGKVHVNGRPVKSSHRLSEGDVVEVKLDLPPSLTALPEDIRLTVVYRDDDLAVIDKPANMVVHPAAGHSSGTLANALTALFPTTRTVGAPERPGIVHRLDKDTSGLIVVALTPRAQVSLQLQIRERTAQRVYLALVSGHPNTDSSVIDAPIGRDPTNRRRMSVHGAGARAARTSYHVLEQLPESALVEATLQTGRTHQIRVHLAAIGHPLTGDTLYGGPALAGLHRQFLHAHRLSFNSPANGTRLEFRSELPADLSNVLTQLRDGLRRSR